MHGAAIGADQGVAFGQGGDQFRQGLRWPGDHGVAACSFEYVSRLGVVTRMQRIVFGAG